MALRTLQSIVATNYNNLTSDPVLAGDIVAFNTGSQYAAGVNPGLVARACRGYNTSGSTNTASTAPVGVFLRAQIVGVCADDALGVNPAGETPFMINNDPAGSNFVNGSIFQSYTAGFYVGAKRAIGDYKDESISIVANLTQGVPIYDQRGVSVYTSPSTQFVTDRFVLATANAASADATGWTNAGSQGTGAPLSGDLLTVGGNNTATINSYAFSPSAPTVSAYTGGSTTNANLSGLLISAGTYANAATVANYVPIVGRVDFYDSGAGLLYWTLL